PSVNELLEKSLPAETLDRLSRAIMSVPGVKAFHHLRTRRNGHSYLAEVHIKVDPDITVTQGHAISTAVEIALRAILGQDSIITVHVEPYHRSLTP
ncbi:MAG: cation-efflux pump, partial [Duncaniella sp.]|nr:cation-efflux pump [Duncaniella sp.]